MSIGWLEYKTPLDWLKFRPILRVEKIFRRRLIGRTFLLKAAPDSNSIKDLQRKLGTRPLIVTIAYNTAWTLEWQFKFEKLNFPDVDRLIADNSSDPAQSGEIEAICRRLGAAYIKLPFNRFSVGVKLPIGGLRLGRPHPSLSHAVALNWVWKQIVQKTRPPLVAILDHDLIACAPVDFSARLKNQSFYGLKMTGVAYGWTLWPGYALFDRSIIDKYPVNFWVDEFAQMDTGGGNWRGVFRYFNPAELNFSAMHDESHFDEWFHIGGASNYANNKPANWRDFVDSVLAKKFAEISTAPVSA